MNADNTKLRELVILILSKFPDGLTEFQLNELLFKCDFEAFARFGKSITGSTYYKGRDGAVNLEFSGRDPSKEET